MHYLYTPVSINGTPFIAKLTVEEYDLIGKTRACNLQRIELSNLSRAQFSEIIQENREKYAYKSDALSVAQLYEFVKSKDKNYTPAPEVSKYVLNEDGTPKVFYHGTRADFRDSSFPRYSSKQKKRDKPSFFVLVETVELESTTPCMSSKYSNQLSYASVFN